MNIKVITEPKVYLVAHQQIHDDGLAAFLADNGTPGWESSTSCPAQVLVEVGGRLCYQSFANPRPGGNEGYIRHILEVGHGSVLEHAVFTLILTGISRSLSHELVRHRVGLSPSQLSQRYVDESEVAFVLPPALLAAYVPPPGEGGMLIRRNAPGMLQDALKGWFLANSAALESYTDMAEALVHSPGIVALPVAGRRKAAREAARSVLTNSAETKTQITGNARAWRHFLELRGSLGADAEIRRLAFATLPVLQFASPNLFGDYLVRDGGGVECLFTPYPRV